MLQKLNNISIVYKLSGIITLLIIVSMLFVGIFTYSTNKEAIIDRTYEQLTSVRFEKTQRLENFIDNKILEIGQFASTSEAESIFECVLNSDEVDAADIDMSEFNRFFGDYLKMQAQVNRFVLLSDSNTYFIDPNSSQDYFYSLHFSEIETIILENNNDDKQIISDLMLNDKKKIVFYIFTQLQCKKSDVYIGFEIPIDQINNIMLEDNPYNGLGASGEVYLVGSDKLMRSQSRFVENSVLSIVVPNPLIDNISNEQSGKNLIIDYRDVKVLSSYGTISWGSTSWLIFAEIDYKEALIPVYAFRDSIIFLGILGTIMFIAVIMILTIFFTRPISKLKKAADEISAGNYNIYVPVKSNDEIGQLSSTFNSMAGKIDDQKQKLDFERMNRVQEMIDWQETERQRLSRELHDGIGQLLLSAKMRVGRINGMTTKDAGIIEDTEIILQQTVKDVRDISNNLMPSVLSEFGLNTGISNLCNQILIDHNLSVDFKTNIEKIEDLKTSTYIYRIVQEALTNIIKHSKAKNAIINLQESPREYILIIQDDGVGFDDSSSSPNIGNGLRNINDRAKLLNGTSRIESQKGNGTRIIVKMPKSKKHG